MSSGSTDSNRLSAWPNFIAPPLSSPSTRKSCSAARCCICSLTCSAGAPPSRLPRPSVARPAKPSGREASRALRRKAERASESRSVRRCRGPLRCRSRSPFCSDRPTTAALGVCRPAPQLGAQIGAVSSSVAPVVSGRPPSRKARACAAAVDAAQPVSRSETGSRSAAELGQHRRPARVGVGRVRSVQRTHGVRPGRTSGPTQTASPSERTSRCGWSSRSRWSVITRSTSGPSATTTVRSTGSVSGLLQWVERDDAGRAGQHRRERRGLVGQLLPPWGTGPGRAAGRRRRPARRRRHRPGSEPAAARRGRPRPVVRAAPALRVGRTGSAASRRRAGAPPRSPAGRQPGRLSGRQQARPGWSAHPRAGRAAGRKPSAKTRARTRVQPHLQLGAGVADDACRASTAWARPRRRAGATASCRHPGAGEPGELSTGFLDRWRRSGTARGGRP